jgi:hypothetical protein
MKSRSYLKNAQVGLERDKMRVGRNDPCPCKSGLKYKKCCGNPLKERTAAPRPIPFEVLAELKRREAAELVRQQQQGLGNPIVSLKMNDQQIVAVGNTVRCKAINAVRLSWRMG